MDGKEAVLERHLRRAAIALHCGSDLPGFVPGGHQGFLAVDVFLLGDRREQGFAVPVVGCADVDDIDVGVLGHRAEIGRGHVGPEQPPGLFGRFRPPGDDVRDPGRKRRRIVVKRQGRIAIGMHLADHAETEDANAIGFHGISFNLEPTATVKVSRQWRPPSLTRSHRRACGIFAPPSPMAPG